MVPLPWQELALLPQTFDNVVTVSRDIQRFCHLEHDNRAVGGDRKRIECSLVSKRGNIEAGSLCSFFGVSKANGLARHVRDT
jgi:hypothetical protein